MRRLLVDAKIPAGEDLFGKTAEDLQENVNVESAGISGTLSYIEDYSEISPVSALQKGNYLALRFRYDPTDLTGTINVSFSENGNTAVNIKQLSDSTSQFKSYALIGRITAPEGTVTVSAAFRSGGTPISSARTYPLSSLTLEQEDQP